MAYCERCWRREPTRVKTIPADSAVQSAPVEMPSRTWSMCNQEDGPCATRRFAGTVVRRKHDGTIETSSLSYQPLIPWSAILSPTHLAIIHTSGIHAIHCSPFTRRSLRRATQPVHFASNAYSPNNALCVSGHFRRYFDAVEDIDLDTAWILILFPHSSLELEYTGCGIHDQLYYGLI